MKVLVLGSGVIGVSSAYQLALAGHEVTVVDRQPAAGMETSYGNAGEVSPGYSSPWAGPGVPLKAVKWLLMHHRPLVIRPQLDLALVRWGFAMLRNCTAARYALNKGRMVRLAEYSRDCLRELRAQTGIEYDQRMQGTLQLFRTQAQLDGTAADIAVLRRDGVPFELLDREGCIRHEPALAAVREKFVGGLLLPGDETGDCFQFTQRLAALAAGLGVQFRYGTQIRRIEASGGAITGVQTAAGTLAADAYLVALGSHSPLLLKDLGLRIPVYPVKGYSITVPITDAAGAPESTVMDETHKVAVTRLGERIRVGGTAELAGYTLKLHEARRQTLEHVVTDLFPQGGDVSRAEFWCGLRPMTPDGTPIVGATRWPNLFLATGHGTLGWTMAVGTGRALADVISGRTPDIDLDGLTVARYADAYR
ncbi:MULTISPECIES: D-amino acid dehydrogenase [unclassified Variovorax]|uniref:D-amino acid dehydrogenase n=1 Tax=unclassified Variovorax TaxID=663243 RepID=UPI002574BC8A|nr:MULTISPECIES: D-amino acid dehydrogenase [unclassified Variovorax]MDM0089915.1 D-amino acid dehydrogenase [Variovorax sp. J22G40]MDM0148419.1 D-amino acid dehydrogenase [Variovorax sp. J2P1-31]